jgi:hypothetical protein
MITWPPKALKVGVEGMGIRILKAFLEIAFLIKFS